MAPPFPESQYIDFNLGLLDTQRFVAMRDAGTVEELADRNGIKHLTAAGGWKKRWNQWGGHGCLTTAVPDGNLYMSYTSCEESDYVKRLGEIIDVMDEIYRYELAHRDFCCLHWPYDELWFIRSHYYWWRTSTSNDACDITRNSKCLRVSTTRSCFHSLPLSFRRSTSVSPHVGKKLKFHQYFRSRSLYVFLL